MPDRGWNRTGRTILPGDPPIEITLTRSARARRISLRVSRLDGGVTLSLPGRTSESEGLAFARTRETWLRRVLAAQVTPARPVIGGTLPVEGRAVPIVAGKGRAAAFVEGRLEVPPGPERVGPHLAAWLREFARARLVAAAGRHAGHLGRACSGVVLRDTRSRWGSCTADGRLMFSWRLGMAPPEVLDYVAAHEVAHLVEMNHSPAFWAVVARLVPDYERARAWLRVNGQALHRWRFEAAAAGDGEPDGQGARPGRRG